MPLFRRRTRTSSGGGTRSASRDLNEGVRHLEQWASERRGVEAFVEPQTAVTETTILLVAATGEWTRRRVNGPKAAADFARRIGIPIYDAQIVGYPQRMREWNERQRNGGAADASTD